MKLMNGIKQKAKRLVDESAYKKLLKLAKETDLLDCDKDNFDTQNMDSEDFYEISVWSANEAIQRAYLLGYEQASKSSPKVKVGTVVYSKTWKKLYQVKEINPSKAKSDDYIILEWNSTAPWHCDKATWDRLLRDGKTLILE